MYLCTKVNLQEVGWGDMDWTDLAQATDRWPELEPSGSIKWGGFIEQLKTG